MDQIEKILNRIGYGGVFPPTIKKLFPPYWRFLAHSFVICISGRKAGAYEISLLNTGAIAALVMDLDFSFSRFVLNEMKNNLQGKRKDKILMYPRFLQLIFNAKYPELKGRGKTLDLKSLGPSTFGLMKQNRKVSKYVFQGTKPLEKFGCFAKIGEDLDSDEALDDEDDEVTVSDQEYDTNPPIAILAEEHVPMINVNDDHEDDDDDDEEDDAGMDVGDNALGFDDGARMGQEIDLSGFDDDDLCFDFELNDKDLNSFFDNIDDVEISPTETQGETNVLKLPQQTPDQMDDLIANLVSTIRILPPSSCFSNLYSI